MKYKVTIKDSFFGEMSKIFEVSRWQDARAEAKDFFSWKNHSEKGEIKIISIELITEVEQW